MGAYILPPCETGAKCSSDFGAASVHRRDRVYLTTSEAAAVLFAGLHPSGAGMVYRVDPDGAVEIDPDCSEPGLSWQAPRAKVIGYRRLRAAERRTVLAAMAPDLLALQSLRALASEPTL
jgi:hypothetical protein